MIRSIQKNASRSNAKVNSFTALLRSHLASIHVVLQFIAIIVVTGNHSSSGLILLDNGTK